MTFDPRRQIAPVRPDLMLIGMAVMLAVCGLVLVYSATVSKPMMPAGAAGAPAPADDALTAEPTRASGMQYLQRQIVFFIIGLAVMAWVASWDYRRLADRRIAYVLLLGAMGALALTHAPGIGKSVNGAARWIALGSVRVQPGEFAKVAVVIFLAMSIARRGEEKMRSLKFGVMPNVTIPGVVIGLLMLQPDFGSSVIVAAIVGVMLFVGGARLWHLGLGALASAGLFAGALIAAPYRMRRMLAFLDPWEDYRGSGYQTIQSLVAFGSGGVTGRDLGAGRQKLAYLPEIHTDFVFSNLGEELGFIGAFVAIALFSVLIFRGMIVARRAADPFGRLLGFGAIALIGIQVIINMGVVMGLLPTKGLALPFFSYGGSSLIASFILIGLLLSVSRYADLEEAR
ncbi:putative lipid II flippase FtsW [bacterium]|nr:putative lipid II flippase FtsW [bacterium]